VQLIHPARLRYNQLYRLLSFKRIEVTMSFTPNYLSQRDPRWKDEQLGFDNTITIGTDGCALTSLTMLVNGYGFNETPSTVNQKLKAMGAGGGFIGGLVIWGSLTRSFPKIVYQNIIQWNNPPAVLDSIDTSIAAGQPVVVEVDRSPSPGLQNHWVVLYGKQGSDYLMLDPWPYPTDSGPTTLIGRYGFGRQPQEFILAAVWYLTVGPSTPSAPPSGAGFYVQVPITLVTGLNLRSSPSVSGTLITRESAGSWLKVLESAAAAQAKIGVQDQWLNVLDPQGNSGYVAAWYIQSSSGQPAPAPSPQPSPAPAPQPSSPTGLTVVVSSQATAGIRMRDQPNLNGKTVAIESAGAILTVLEASATAQAKIGQQDQWLNVKDGSGNTGYVAAWFVLAQSGSAPAPSSGTTSTPQPPSGTVPASLTVVVSSQASAGLRLRDQPNTNGNILKSLSPATVLQVLEPASSAQAKIGVNGQWLNVKEPGGMTGYVAAWYVVQ
jgi:hypothetical protein